MLVSIYTWIFVFVRASAFLVIFPLFSSTNVPVRIRVALAAALGAVIAPGLGTSIDVTKLGLLTLILLIFKEVMVGLMLGFVCRMVFYGLQLAGHFISTEIGLQTATIVSPDASPVDVPGAVLNLLAMMMFLSLDVHHSLIIAFQQTYQVLPIGSGTLSNPLFADLTLRSSKLFLLALQMAAPLIAVGFLVSIVLGMLGRAVPQMNIFFESFAIRLLAGLIVFSLSITLMAQRLSDYLKRVPQDVLEVSRLLTGG